MGISTPQEEKLVAPDSIIDDDDEEEEDDDDEPNKEAEQEDGDSKDEEDEPVFVGDEDDDKKKPPSNAAMTPDNVLLPPWKELCQSYSRLPSCPKCYRKTLVAKASTKGAITDLLVSCTRDNKHCKESFVIQSPFRKNFEATGDDKTPQQVVAATKFGDYGINYRL